MFAREVADHIDADYPSIHYIKFYSRLFEDMPKRFGWKYKFLHLTNCISDYQTTDELKFWLLWPFNNKKFFIKLSKLHDADQVEIKIYIDNNNILSINIHKEIADVLLNDKKLSPDDLNNKCIASLIFLFNDYFRLGLSNIMSLGKNISFNQFLINSSNSLSLDQLKKLIDFNINFDLPTRIHNIFSPGSKKTRPTKKLFINWPDGKGNYQNINVALTRGCLFEWTRNRNEDLSWILSEKTLFGFDEYKDMDLKDERFYKFSVVENIPKILNRKASYSTILNIWLTLDGQYGEIRDLKKGAKLSGNQVIAIFNIFNCIFQIKKLFLCDISYLTDASGKEEIPLRLIHAITTGKTWYESKLPGLKLFECTDFSSLANGLITQHGNVRQASLQALRNLPLSSLFDMFDSLKKMQLLRLYQAYMNDSVEYIADAMKYKTRSSRNIMELFDPEHTVFDLTSKVYNTARQSGLVSKDLIILSNLFTSGVSENGYLKNWLSANYWLTSNVGTLTYGSLFWMKPYNDSDLDSNLFVKNLM